MIRVSISDCSVFFPPSDLFVASSLSVGTCWPVELREAYRGAFSGVWEGSGWGSAVCASWLASRSTSGGATGVVPLSWTDFLATCLASYLLAGWLLVCLASYSPSWVWIGFFAETALAFP